MKVSISKINLNNIETTLTKLGVDPCGISIMKDKFENILIRINNIPTTVALIIKQEMLSKGGEVATPRGMIAHHIDNGDIIISGTISQYKKLINKLAMQPFSLKDIAEQINRLIIKKQKPLLKIRDASFDFQNKKYLMGVLNPTPDSFSDGGLYQDTQQAIKHALEMIRDGADIIDIGGQSTRPDAKIISAKKELSRVIPIIKDLRTRSNIPISIDTYYSEVADAAIENGADIINDISAGSFDSEMLKTAAKHNCPIILMHMQGNPQNMQKNPTYNNTVIDILDHLKESANSAIQSGIDPNQIIIDPGIGFGKNLEQNIEIISNINMLTSIGYPVLVGLSRKSYIEQITGAKIDDRINETIASNALVLYNGASIIRVHDIKEHKKIIRLINAFKNKEES